MHKGNAFSDIGDMFAYATTVTGNGTSTSNNIDTKGYNSFRISWLIDDLSGVTATADIQLKLEHAEDSNGMPGAWANVGTYDIIGPQDEYLNAYTITGGIYKKLVTVDTDLFTGQGEAIYPVAYIGGKRWVRTSLILAGHSAGSFIAVAFVHMLYIHTGVPTPRYAFEGSN